MEILALLLTVVSMISCVNASPDSLASSPTPTTNTIIITTPLVGTSRQPTTTLSSLVDTITTTTSPLFQTTTERKTTTTTIITSRSRARLVVAAATAETCPTNQICIPDKLCNSTPAKHKQDKTKSTRCTGENQVCCPKQRTRRCPLPTDSDSLCRVRWVRGLRKCRLICEEEDHSGFTVGQVFKRDCDKGSVWSRKLEKCQRNQFG